MRDALAIEGLERLRTERHPDVLPERGPDRRRPIDLDGYQLMFGSTDNQGSDAVFLTQIDANGEYQRGSSNLVPLP